MATFAAAEIAADAILIGRYFGRTSTAASLARVASSTAGVVSTTAARSSFAASEGDGPGVRMMTSAGGSGSMGAMSMSAAAGAGSVRFMSMFGGRRSNDPIMDDAICKYF